jgi:hypothetical protein
MQEREFCYGPKGQPSGSRFTNSDKPTIKRKKFVLIRLAPASVNHDARRREQERRDREERELPREGRRAGRESEREEPDEAEFE